MRMDYYPVSPTTPWRLAKCATRWSPGTNSRGWRRCARARGSRARTPPCCCRSYIHPRRRPRSAARGTPTTRVCGDITRDTSTDTSARRQRTRAPGIAFITKAPSTRCSKPCPSDKGSGEREEALPVRPRDTADRQLSGHRVSWVPSLSDDPTECEQRFLIYTETVFFCYCLYLLLCLTSLGLGFFYLEDSSG